jgi:hypothetical protein
MGKRKLIESRVRGAHGPHRLHSFSTAQFQTRIRKILGESRKKTLPGHASLQKGAQTACGNSVQNFVRGTVRCRAQR